MSQPVCEHCGRDVMFWSNLLQDDDGMWRCTSCRMQRLRDNASWAQQRCSEPRCGLAVQDHIEEFRRIVTSRQWQEQFKSKRDDPSPPPVRASNLELTASPSLFERSGVHVMRPRAIAWCRQHRLAAVELPGWNSALLAKILEFEEPTIENT